MKTIAWKLFLGLWKPNSFILLCMHALSLNSKFLIERNLFPAFWTTQIDQSSPTDFVLHRPRKQRKKGLKLPLIILISNVTGVGVKFLPWKKSKVNKLLVLFFLANFHVYIEWKDIRVIDISASERQNCLLHLLSLEFRVLHIPRRAAIHCTSEIVVYRYNIT